MCISTIFLHQSASCGRAGEGGGRKGREGGRRGREGGGASGVLRNIPPVGKMHLKNSEYVLQIYY